jgi:lipopolysaccharide/colanic/teichoic acid biosynthesis glycosyltransferase
VFRSVAIRERKRADRSNQPFVLVLVSANDRVGVNAFARWDAAIDALTAAKRDTDVLGWCEQGSVLGIIPTEIRAFDASVAREISARVRRGLATSVNAEALRSLSIRFHVHPDPKSAGTDGSLQADPIPPGLRSPEAQTPIGDAAKRGVDFAGSLILLAALSPLFLLIAALVRLTSQGPTLFKQARVGQMAKPFTMLKFRTMHADVDHALHQEFVTDFIKSASPVREPGNSGFFKITNDPRVTPVGRMLRKTSLDELPQLWNVLRGDMSLVGPRPPIQYEVDRYQSWHRRRVLEAKPGLTGLWQVTGRSRTTFDEMVRLDLRYARTRSLWADLKILLATPAAMISGKGAC